MSLTVNSQVCLLLTARFSDRDQTEVLTPEQWAGLCRAMGGVARLDGLLEGQPASVMKEHGIDDQLSHQIVALLSRGVGLAMASEKWLRSGVWILGAGDAEYPRGLKALAFEQMAPVLFGYGSVEMLEQPAVAIDSRLAELDAEDVVRVVDAMAVSAVGLLDLSPSRNAIMSYLYRGGQAIGVTYKDLVGYGSAANVREAIMKGTMTIVSSRPPGQEDRRPPVYEALIVEALSDPSLTEQLLGNDETHSPEQSGPSNQQLDFDF